MSRLLSKVIIVFISLFAVTQVVAQSPLKIKPQAPETYTVVKGDTLWDISGMYLANPWLWPRLWQANPEIDNPHLIYPGDKLNLIWVNGQPRLSLKPMVKLSPKVRQVEKQALSAVKDGLIVPYLESDILLSDNELKSVSRVLGASSGNRFLTDNESLYISGAQQHMKWGIYRPLETYTRDKHHMVVLKEIAVGEFKSTDGNMSALSITHQTQEILVDDIALPNIDDVDTLLSTNFFPSPAPGNSTAKILGGIESIDYVGKNQVVVIDRGVEDNVQQGSMFELYQPATMVKSNSKGSKVLKQAEKDKLQLPNTRIGSLMVIRPYQYFSLALITESQQPIGENAVVKAPQETTANTTAQ